MPFLANAQSPDYRRFVATPTAPDSVDVARLEQKAFWRASAETFGFNIGLWSFDRYVLDGHYARISWHTIKENFRHGFEWDNDHLHTNTFDHPYNGSIFFNAGRSNGFNFWQSELFAVGGSAMWEMFMECEYPSTNDIIATPIGGAAIGEVLYRTSDLIIDDRTTGGERFGREAAAFLINPMRGITRVITGRAWERRATTGRRFGMPPISVEVSLGGRGMVLHDNDEGSAYGATAEIDIEYGDRYESDSQQPYDYFTFLMKLNAMKTQPFLSRVEIVGRLLSKGLVDRPGLSLSVGMFQHFDYFDSDTIKPPMSVTSLRPCTVPYKLGVPASAGGGLMASYRPSGNCFVDGYLHLNGIALGGILSDFYRYYNRNYNWGSGFSVKASVNVALFGDKFSASVSDQFFRLYTWGGYEGSGDWSLTPDGRPVDIQGDKSSGSFNHLELRLKYRLYRQLYLTGGMDFYRRFTRYAKVILPEGGEMTAPGIESKQIGFFLMLTYAL